MLTIECSAGAASYEVSVFINGMNSTNTTFRCLSNHDCMNRGSTIGKNMNVEV